MGVDFTAHGAPSVHMMYGTMNAIRDAVACGLDKDFGEHYKLGAYIPKNLMQRIDGDILEFLMQSDVEGSLNYMGCKKVAVELSKFKILGGRVVLEKRKNELERIMEYCYVNKQTLNWK